MPDRPHWQWGCFLFQQHDEQQLGQRTRHLKEHLDREMTNIEAKRAAA
ncbi:MAG TPA: hypothetical protein VID04_07590 [Methylomirabilota bacterium]